MAKKKVTKKKTVKKIEQAEELIEEKSAIEPELPVQSDKEEGMVEEDRGIFLGNCVKTGKPLYKKM